MRGFKAASANFGHISTDPSLNLFKAQAAAAAPGASVQPKQSKKRGRLQLVGDDFYRFQVKESRRRSRGLETIRSNLGGRILLCAEIPLKDCVLLQRSSRRSDAQMRMPRRWRVSTP